MNKKTKIFAILVMICIFACLTACSNGLGEKAKTYGLDKTVSINNFKITALEVKESKGTNNYKPGKDNTFIGVRFLIENTSDTEQIVNSIALFNQYADNKKCSYSSSADVAFQDTDLLYGTLAPGKSLEGWAAIEAPENWKNIEYHVKSEFLKNDNIIFKFKK